MTPLPKRITLAAQVTEVLRRGIKTREWQGRLPSEKDLAEHLQVSRMTLRAGMKILRREGMIKIAKGRRTQIVAEGKRAGRDHRGRTVGVVSPIPLGVSSYGHYYDFYRSLLQASGIKVEFYSSARFHNHNPSKALAELVQDVRVDLWVLAMSTGPIQHWFQQRKIPAIVDGSRQMGIHLPAIDVDYSALCRHASGTLLGLGHKRIVYLSSEERTGGDLASIHGFGEGFLKFPQFKGQPAIVYSKDSAEGASQALTRLFRSGSPPTAILIGRLGLTFATLTYLLGNGIGVPRDVSVISRDYSPHFAQMIPAVTHYHFQFNTFARQLARMTRNHFAGILQTEQRFVWPVFAKGGSIGPCFRD